MHLSGPIGPIREPRACFAGVRLSITNTRRLLLCALSTLWKRTEGRSIALAPEQAGEASLLALETALSGSAAAGALGEEGLLWLLGARVNAEDEGFLDLHVARRRTSEGGLVTLAAIYDRERKELFFEVLRSDESLGISEHADDFEDACTALMEFFSERSASVAPI